MRDDQAVEVEPTGLLRTLIKNACVPGSRVVPMMTGGGTDARCFRWKGIPSYGFGVHSPRIAHTGYPLMFHGHNERVDVETHRLSALMREALGRDFLA